MDQDSDEHWDDADTLCAVSIARRVAGEGAARNLNRDFGGQRVYFPRTVDAKHPLSISMGQEAAQKLCDEVYHTSITIPVGDNSPMHMRREMVKWGTLAKVSRAQIAAIAQCTERNVYLIARKLRQTGELPSAKGQPIPRNQPDRCNGNVRRCINSAPN